MAVESALNLGVRLVNILTRVLSICPHILVLNMSFNFLFPQNLAPPKQMINQKTKRESKYRFSKKFKIKF